MSGLHEPIDQNSAPQPGVHSRMRRLWPALVFALGLAVVLQLISRFVPGTTEALRIGLSTLGLIAVFLFAATAAIVVYQVRLPDRIRWSILMAAAFLVTTEAQSTLLQFEAFHTFMQAEPQHTIYYVLRDVAFIGGIGLLLAGFYMSIFELAAARECSEYEHIWLRNEIEERKIVEAALRDSKDRYRLIFEGTEDGVVLLSDSFRLIQFNHRFAEMFGYSSGEAMEINLERLIHRDDLKAVKESYDARLNGRPAPRSIEFRMVHRDGTTRDILGSFDVIMRGEERLCTHGIFRDITTWNANQEALNFRRDLEDVIRATSTSFVNDSFDNLDASVRTALARLGAFTRSDKAFAFRFEKSDPRMTRLYEWCNEGVAPVPPEFTKADLEVAFPHFTQLMRQQESIRFCSPSELPAEAAKERAFVEAHGIHAALAVAMSFQGRLIGFLGIQFHNDVGTIPDEFTGLLNTMAEIVAGAIVRKDSEDALRRNEEKYRNILENIVEGYYETDLEGNLVFSNRSVLDIYGCEPHEIAGMTYTTNCDEEDAAMLREVFSRVYESGQPVEAIHWSIRRKNGELADVEASISLMRDDEEIPIGFRGMVRDVTDRLRAEEERRILEAQIQHAQKLESLGVLAGGIAHDFNNLLMGVLANASLALMDMREDDHARECLENIETAAQRAAELANQMLTYSGKGRTESTAINLSVVAGEMAQLLTASISKKCKIESDLPDDLPTIDGDPSQLSQVILNLITNASEAIEEGTGKIMVRTGVTDLTSEEVRFDYTNFQVSPGRFVYIEVSDSGCGMDDAMLERIFDPFFTTKFTGRGLGLATVLGIVRAHHGAIRVRSRENEGTTFRVMFPASKRAARTASRPAGGASMDATAWLGKTALIIDDEDTVRDVASRILEHAGMQVLVARDGVEGIEIFREHTDRISVVLLDMTMPRMDGVETFLELTRIRENVRVILSSGYNEQQANDSFEGRRPNGFLQKPYKPSDLMASIQSVFTMAKPNRNASTYSDSEGSDEEFSK